MIYFLHLTLFNLEKRIPMSKRCKAILVSGPNAGSQCSSKSALVQETGYCGRHKDPKFHTKCELKKEKNEQEVKDILKEEIHDMIVHKFISKHNKYADKGIGIGIGNSIGNITGLTKSIVTRSMSKMLKNYRHVSIDDGYSNSNRNNESNSDSNSESSDSDNDSNNENKTPPSELKIITTLHIQHKGFWARNAVGTNSDKYRINPIYGSAIKLHENVTGKKRNLCSIDGCIDEQKTGLVGAHVHLYGESFKNNMYIIPMCRRHNNLYALNAELTELETTIGNIQFFPDMTDSSYTLTKIEQRKKLWMALRINTEAVQINY